MGSVLCSCVLISEWHRGPRGCAVLDISTAAVSQHSLCSCEEPAASEYTADMRGKTRSFAVHTGEITWICCISQPMTTVHRGDASQSRLEGRILPGDSVKQKPYRLRNSIDSVTTLFSRLSKQSRIGVGCQTNNAVRVCAWRDRLAILQACHAMLHYSSHSAHHTMANHT